jgi:hypothetical protein
MSIPKPLLQAAAFIALVLIGGAAVPLRDPYLQTDLNGNGRSITNAARVQSGTNQAHLSRAHTGDFTNLTAATIAGSGTNITGIQTNHVDGLGPFAQAISAATTNGLVGAWVTNGLAGPTVTNGLVGQWVTNGLAGPTVTNGLVGQWVTNGLAGPTVTNGLVGAWVTNGLAGPTITNGLVGAWITNGITAGTAGLDRVLTNYFAGITSICWFGDGLLTNIDTVSAPQPFGGGFGEAVDSFIARSGGNLAATTNYYIALSNMMARGESDGWASDFLTLNIVASNYSAFAVPVITNKGFGVCSNYNWEASDINENGFCNVGADALAYLDTGVRSDDFCDANGGVIWHCTYKGPDGNERGFNYGWSDGGSQFMHNQYWDGGNEWLQRNVYWGSGYTITAPAADDGIGFRSLLWDGSDYAFLRAGLADTEELSISSTGASGQGGAETLYVNCYNSEGSPNTSEPSQIGNGRIAMYGLVRQTFTRTDLTNFYNAYYDFCTNSAVGRTAP